MGLDIPPAIEQKVENHHLFISEATRNLLSPDFAAKLSEIAGMDLMVLSPEDIHSSSNKDLEDFMKQFPAFPGQSFVNAYRIEDTNIIAGYASEGSPKSSHMMAFNQASGHTQPACVITLTKMEDISKSLQELSDYSGITVDRFKNVPGQLITLQGIAAHEAGHCTQDYINTDEQGHQNPLTDAQELLSEIGADNIGRGWPR